MAPEVMQVGLLAGRRRHLADSLPEVLQVAGNQQLQHVLDLR